MSLFKDRSRYG